MSITQDYEVMRLGLDGDTEYYESADWYYCVEWDYLDGEEQS